MTESTTTTKEEETSKTKESVADTELDKDLDSISLGDESTKPDNNNNSNNNKDDENFAFLSDDDDDLIVEMSGQPKPLSSPDFTPSSSTGAAINDTNARTKTTNPSSPQPAPASGRRDSVATGKSFKLVNSKTQVYTTNDPPSGTGGPDTAASKVLVILLTNSLGLGSENNLKLADRYAQALNATVVVPDLFEGDPVPNIFEPSDLVDSPTLGHTPAATDVATAAAAGGSNNQEVSTFSLIGKVKLMVASTVKGFFDDMWTAKHGFEITNRRLAQTLHELVTETYKPDKVVLVGYSFGAKYVLHYLKNSRSSAVADKVVCAACLHPSLLEASDFKAIQKPLYFVYARHDDLLPEPLVRKCLEVHEDKNGTAVKIETAVFDNKLEQRTAAAAAGGSGSGTDILPLPHGFAVPGDYPRSIVGDRPERVLNLLTSWIREHL